MDKDKYLSTPDEHFNVNAQYWYFQFKGLNKPLTSKPYEVFIQALFDVYFFIKQNPDKPFACIERIKEISRLKRFNKTEKLIFVDKILGVLFQYPHPDKLQKVYIQLTDFRNDLSPYLENPEIIGFKFKYNIDVIKMDISNIIAPEERYKFIMNLIFDFQASVFEMGELELVHYQDVHLLEYLKIEAERAKFNNSIPPKTPSEKLEQETTKQKIERILEPTRNMFDSPEHINKIVNALANYSDSKDLPEKADIKTIHVPNKEFYPYFKKVKNETNLTVEGIASVLHYFVCTNNGTINELAPCTIVKNIKKSYNKLYDGTKSVP